MTAAWSAVVPTVGRPELARMLASLARAGGPPPQLVVLADDRRGGPHLPLETGTVAMPVRTVRTGGRGPAVARNAGWRQVTTPWVVFLDDDVVLPPGWGERLADDLTALADGEGASYGRLRVPVGPRPTDWERNTHALERALWATADAAIPRSALEAVDGFDERFPRAYREDADLAVRLRRHGCRLTTGTRVTVHPVRSAGGAISLRTQAGARDDALLRALHGPRWRFVAQVGTGRFPRHVATVLAGLLALTARAAGLRRTALVGVAAWAALTGEFLARRIAPGPRPGDAGWTTEWARMAWTSALIPPAAVAHRLAGTIRSDDRPWRPPVRAVLFDRDGTLVHDVPYNGDPDLVVPVPGARRVLDELRSDGLAVGLVTNQSAVGLGRLSAQDVAAVNQRVAELLGPLDVVAVCPHAPADGCGCRKPDPGLVLHAAGRLGLAPWECVVVGDTGADVGAALAAGARAVLVPTPHTLPDEVTSAPVAVGDLEAALAHVRRFASPPAPAEATP